MDLRNADPALRSAWQVLCRLDELDEDPKGYLLVGTPLVAWLAPSGDPAVFFDRCPHRLAPLSIATCEDAGSIRCAYHGWVFDAEGTCIEIPALGPDATIPPRASLTAPAAVATSHGLVVVAIEPPRTPLPVVTAATDPRFQRGDLPVTRALGCAGLFADNFLDAAHFPFVHAETFGAAEERVVPGYELVRDSYAFTATYRHTFANREDPLVATGERPLLQERLLTYRYTAPFHLELEIEYLDAGGTNVIGFFVSPEDDDHLRIYSTLWRDDLGGSEEAMAEAVAFEVAVLEEDLRIQSAFRERRLPLDLTEELHTKADRTTVELRRILADLVAAAPGT